MKQRRHAKILELIGKYDIDTQEELLRRLREGGVEVTQATVSRDIKELRLMKTPTGSGKYKYAAGKDHMAGPTPRFFSLLIDSAVSIDSAGNMVVIRCQTGMAQAVCAALDAVGWEGVVGSLAGDDTIFLVARDEANAERIASEFKRIIG